MKQNRGMSESATHYIVLIDGFLWDDRVYNSGDLIARDPNRPALDYALGQRQIDLHYSEPEPRKTATWRISGAIARIMGR